MVKLHPQFITDSVGAKMVVLSQDEFNSIMDELDELEDIRLYDEAKKEDDGTRILFSDFVKKRKSLNA